MSCIKKLFQTKRGCSDRKPNVPRQLRSVACYQDGKVDVSILGDQRYLDNTEAVNLHITFVHRPMSTSKVKTTTLTPSTLFASIVLYTRSMQMRIKKSMTTQVLDKRITTR